MSNNPHLDMIDKLFITATERMMGSKDEPKAILGRILRDFMPGMTRELQKHQEKYPLDHIMGEVKNEAKLIHAYATACSIVITHLLGCLNGPNIPKGTLCTIAKGMHDQMHRIEGDPIAYLDVSEQELDTIIKEFFPHDAAEINLEEIIKNIIKAGKDLP